jgi:hypothetical protein
VKATVRDVLVWLSDVPRSHRRDLIRASLDRLSPFGPDDASEFRDVVNEAARRYLESRRDGKVTEASALQYASRARTAIDAFFRRDVNLRSGGRGVAIPLAPLPKMTSIPISGGRSIVMGEIPRGLTMADVARFTVWLSTYAQDFEPAGLPDLLSAFARISTSGLGADALPSGREGR